MLRSIGNSPRSPWNQMPKKKKKATVERTCSEGVMDDESDESMEPI